MGSSIKYVCTLAEEGKLLVDVRCVLHVKKKLKIKMGGGRRGPDKSETYSYMYLEVVM